MTSAIKAKLDKAVAAKMLTSAQEQQILSTLSSRLDAEISGKGPGMMHRGWGQMGRRGFFAPPGGTMRLYPSAPVPPSPPPAPGQPPAPGPVY